MSAQVSFRPSLPSPSDSPAYSWAHSLTSPAVAPTAGPRSAHEAVRDWAIPLGLGLRCPVQTHRNKTGRLISIQKTIHRRETRQNEWDQVTRSKGWIKINTSRSPTVFFVHSDSAGGPADGHSWGAATFRSLWPAMVAKLLNTSQPVSSLNSNNYCSF